jgi:hypothetical protein
MEDVKLIAVGQIINYHTKNVLSKVYLVEFDSGFMGYCETPVEDILQVMTSGNDYETVRYAHNLRPPSDAEAKQADNLFDTALDIIHHSEDDNPMHGMFGSTVMDYKICKKKGRFPPDIFHFKI